MHSFLPRVALPLTLPSIISCSNDSCLITCSNHTFAFSRYNGPFRPVPKKSVITKFYCISIFTMLMWHNTSRHDRDVTDLTETECSLLSFLRHLSRCTLILRSGTWTLQTGHETVTTTTSHAQPARKCILPVSKQQLKKMVNITFSAYQHKSICSYRIYHLY